MVTCVHVMEAFMEKNIKEQLASIPEEQRGKAVREIGKVRAYIPHALFYILQPKVQQVVVACVGVKRVLVQTDSTMDLGVLWLSPHDAFRDGFPTMAIEDFENVHDGLEVATCGFPLGNLLFEQLGTVTSSLSRGIVSSTIPTSGVSRDHVTGFQLDLKTTHGNSGGPVFCWETGRVFGVLQGGINDQYGNHLFSRAESVYRLVDAGLVERVLNPPRLSAGRDG